MPGFDQTGPMGQGPMTGRRMGRRNLSNKGKPNDEIKRALAGLIAVSIIGAAEKVWNWIKVKRLKSGLK
jgi:hypothetical protein